MFSAWLGSTLKLWSTTLRQTEKRIRPLFAAPSDAASANAFLDGLLGGERRKTGWMRAEVAGDPSPWRQQAILGRTHRDAQPLRDVVRDDVVETLASPMARRGSRRSRMRAASRLRRTRRRPATSTSPPLPSISVARI